MMDAMFPLPLTSFEEYMFRDDRPGYPTNVVLRLRFAGFLDQATFTAALDATVARHPLLRATVDPESDSRPRWLDHPDWRPVVHWNAATNQYGYPPTVHIDLTREPAVRVCVVDLAAGHDVVLQVHHAVADAVGLNRFVEDLLVAYALHCGDAPPGLALVDLEPARLWRRAAPGLSFPKSLTEAWRQVAGFSGVYRFFVHRPVPLRPSLAAIDERSPPPVLPCPTAHGFDPEETRRILAAAKARNVTVNDSLVRDLFLAVSAWRRRHGIGSDGDWLRLAIPVNLREAGDERMPVANSVSIVFVDRQPRELDDSEHLLRNIQRQLWRAKHGQSTYTYVQALSLLRRLPGGMTPLVRANRCRATTLLSNLGRVLVGTPLPRQDGRLVSGNVVLEGLEYVAPLRPYLHAAFTVFTYAGRLGVTMHSDPRALPDELARGLLDDFVAQVRQSAADVTNTC
jgi:hypothetical protein